MRRLNVTEVTNRKALKVVKELDVFPKVPETYQETSASGGGLSVVIFILIGILVTSEVIYYSNTSLKFDYEVDTDFEGKLKLNIDMTVAMKCGFIGADVLDVTGQDTHGMGKLNMEPAYFELSENQRQYLMFLQEINRYMREEYHALHELLWTSKIQDFKSGMPQRIDKPDHPPDACRIHGSLLLNKVAGNYHITAGKSIPVIPRGHAHLSIMLNEKDYNFSHRIDHFSFGEPANGIVHPLDGEEAITTDNYHIYQYFMQIVPTEVRTLTTRQDTYQFAVTERNRTINHSKGSHGVPGIFVKYDISSLKVRVREEWQPLWSLLIRLCGIIGGIFAVSGMLYNFIGFITEILCCRYKVGKYKTEENQNNIATTDKTSLHSLHNNVFAQESKVPFTLVSKDVT